MPSANAQHDLLLGMLALQMNFVDRRELAAAFDACAGSSRGLGQVLLERRALGHTDLELLERLAERFQGVFGAELAGSLSALSATADECEVSAILGDAHPTTSLNDPEAVDDAFATQAPTTVTPTTTRRYQPVRRHAKGGLGEVWLAIDEELKREVALKELRKKHAGSVENRERFLLEAEITGGLEHPGIVPVYGMGRYSDGRPYYAMRFIRGESLRAAIDAHYAAEQSDPDPGARSLALRHLLGVLIQVCRTVEYAHSRGVLHRDLKPANIMLGKYGETLVVDWGLAKSENRQSHDVDGSTAKSGSTSGSSLQTQAGSAIGTPAYMSPEQAEGRLDDLGPATDIYSLGATLYHIVAGRPPVEANTLAGMIDIVRSGRIPPARTIRPGVPLALDAICRRAMSLRPANRYPSAQAMADDLEHWLADEPVVAWREPWTATLARWTRRHRSAALAGTFAAFILIGAIAWSYVAGVRRDMAEAHARDIEREADRALHALEDVFKVVSANDVADEKTLQPVRTSLLHYYQEYLDQRGFDTARKLDLAQANEKMAQMTRLVGTKYEALGFLQRAERIYRDLAEALPTEADDFQARRARCLVDQGALLHDLGRDAEADASYAESLKIQEPLADRDPVREEWQVTLANAYHNRAILRQDTGERVEAVELFERGRDKRQELLQRHPQDRAIRRDLAISFGYLGDAQLELGHEAEAKLAYDESERHRLDLVQSNRRDPEARFQLARSYENTASYYHRRRNVQGDKAADFQQARDYLIKSRDVRQELVREKPDNSRYRQDFGWACQEIGDVSLELGDFAEAEKSLRQGELVFQELLDDDPQDTSSRDGRARSRLGASAALLAMAQAGNNAAESNTLRMESLKLVENARADLRLLKADQTSEGLFSLGLVEALRAQLLPESAEASRENAIAFLERALTKGYRDWPRLARERAFQPFREHPKFKALLNRLN